MNIRHAIGTSIGRQQNLEQSSPPAKRDGFFSGPTEWAGRQFQSTETNEPVSDDLAAQAKALCVPYWVIEHGLADYVRDARHFAEFGIWPSGSKPKLPSMRGLAIWQIKWVKYQHDRSKLAEWKQKRNATKRPRLTHVAFSVATTPEEWKQRFDQREQAVKECRALGIPAFVGAHGFLPYVLASRYYALHGVWENGKRPKYPNFTGLTIWQIKWIKLQRNSAKFEQWQSDHPERSKEKRAQARAAQRETLIQDINSTPYDQPLPIRVTSLGEMLLARKKARAA